MADDSIILAQNNDDQEEPNESKIPNLDKIDVNKLADSSERIETTRSKIATIYVWAFFLTILATLIVGLITSFDFEEYREILITVSGILSGPLGFIIGYYFKSVSNKE